VGVGAISPGVRSRAVSDTDSCQGSSVPMV
jgi:hypothetical protein